MRIRLLPILGLLCAFSKTTFLCAENLSFDTYHAETRALIGQRFVRISFPCINRGNVPIKFIGVEAGCSCTSASFEPAALASGQRGNVVMIIDLAGKNVGHLSTSISVQTDQPNEKAYVLVGDVINPTGISIYPTLLKWRIGELATEKKVHISYGSIKPDSAMLSARVDSVHGAFVATVKTDSEPGTYWVLVKPKDTDTKYTAVIHIEIPGGSTDGNLPPIYAIVER